MVISPPPFDHNTQSVSPATQTGPRVPLYGPEFLADPDRVYRDMRDKYRTMVPVELAPGVPATLIIGYRDGLKILGDSFHYSSDPRCWQQGVPSDCPVLPLLQWRPNAIRSAETDHVRLRSATAAALGAVDLHGLQRTVEGTARTTINTFCGSGSAELLGQYAFPLTFKVLNELLGLSATEGKDALSGMADILNAADSAAAHRGNELFETVLLEVTQRKRANPGADLVSSLVRHPAGLTDTEVVNQSALFYAAGTEALCGLILNTLFMMFTDDLFSGQVLSGVLTTRDALDEVLFTNPPWSNFCVRYPSQPQLIDDIWLPAHQPVIVSATACNSDSETRGDRTGNRSHLSWGAGSHACPAQSLAMIIARGAIDQLVDALPEMALGTTVDSLKWRTGPLHRMLDALPVIFPAAPLLPS